MVNATGGSIINSGRNDEGNSNSAEMDAPQAQKLKQDASTQDNSGLTELIQKAMRGNSLAFEHLYKRYIKEIIYHARNLLAAPEDAEDAAQEIIIALHRNMGGLKSPYAFKSYLLRIVYSVCTTRNRKTKQPSEQIDNYEEILEDESELGPEGSLEQLELSEAIQTALGQLPPKQRETLTLRYFDDLEYEEIAQLQGVSVSTVGSNILRAKKALKHLIEKSEGAYSQGEGKGMDEKKETTGLHQQEQQAGQQQEAALSGEDRGPQTLKGVAIGPAVAAALAQSIDDSVGSESVQGVVKGVNGMLLHNSTVAAASAGMMLRTKILIAVVLATVVLGGMVIAYQVVASGSGAGTGPEATAPISEYKPEAQIEFSGSNITSDTDSGVVEQVNPTGARLVLDEGTALSWVITNSNDEELASGLGGSIEGVFEDLLQGDYTLTWLAESDEGAQARISRDFTIASE